jgi:RNA polymerase sigma-70 factor (ECF subfamily)
VSTEELIEKGQKRDPVALCALYERFHDVSRGFAHYHLGNHPEVEDIVQSAWLKVFKCLNQFRGTGQFSTWLYTIVLNECRGFHRCTLRSRTISLDDEIRAGHWNNLRAAVAPFRIDLDFEQEDVRRRVLRALELLPRTYRQVLSMRYVSGLTLIQIATILRISEAAVKSRMMRARNELKTKMQDVKRSVTRGSTTERAIEATAYDAAPQQRPAR